MEKIKDVFGNETRLLLHSYSKENSKNVDEKRWTKLEKYGIRKTCTLNKGVDIVSKQF